MIFYFSAPFDVSLAVLTLMTIIIVFTWSENFGDKTGNWKQNFSNALSAIRNGEYCYSYVEHKNLVSPPKCKLVSCN